MVNAFRADLNVIKEASKGITKTLTESEHDGLERLADDKAQLGDPGVSEAFGEFCSRWQDGLDQLTLNAESSAAALDEAANVYLECDLVNSEGIATLHQ